MNMARVPTIILFGVLLALTTVGQTDRSVRLREMNERFSRAAQNLDWAEAEKRGSELLQIATEDFGSKSREAAKVHFDLCLVQRQSGKFSEAKENLATAREILEQLVESEQGDLVSVYSAIGYDSFYERKYEEAKAYYLKSLAKADQILGVESKESFLPLINLANLALSRKAYSEANQYQIKAYFVARNKFPPGSDAAQQILDTRICQDVESQLSKQERAAFDDIQKQYFASRSPNQGVLNGKAKSLPKPAYPLLARTQHITGRVVVEVLIDEVGKVDDTRFVCGDSTFAEATLAAVRGAKFSPTLVDGVPTKVHGYIVYNFVP